MRGPWMAWLVPATVAGLQLVGSPDVAFYDRSADLGARKHRDNLGLRCTVAQVGEADWTITCKRGREVVRGSVST